MKLNNSGDKKGHGYLSIYEKLFSPIYNEVQNLLEIGVRQGESIKSWKDFFVNAHIYGLDFGWPKEGDYKFIDILNNIDGVTIHKGDQSCKKTLDKIKNETPVLDIIIDDGSHILEHQQLTFFHLFDHLKNGGFYVIEDIHTSVFPHMKPRYGLNKNESNSTYLMFQRFEKTGLLKSVYFDKIFSTKEIKLIHLNTSIAVVQKQT